ncbi:MAG: sulfur carrier protein ThiS [Desulfobacteraceae bacterium]|nr:MAG: sulfur carrier protein ThiS [Desulfobacteraceae bacterium]
MIIVDDKEVAWAEHMTVASLLEQLEDTEFCSVVRLNGKLVSSPKFTATPVPDKSVIQLLPLVAGG